MRPADEIEVWFRAAADHDDGGADSYGVTLFGLVMGYFDVGEVDHRKAHANALRFAIELREKHGGEIVDTSDLAPDWAAPDRPARR